MQQEILDILQDFSRSSPVQPVNVQRFESLFIRADDGYDLEQPSISDVLNNSSEHPNIFDADERNIDKAQSEHSSSTTQILLGDHENIVTDLKMHHDDAIEELAAAHQQGVIKLLSNIHIQVIDGLVEQVERNLVNVITPLMKNCVAQANIDAMISELTKTLKTRTVGRLRLAGPPTLIEPVKAALEHLNLDIEVEESDEVDLTASIDKQVWSTSLDEWSNRLEGLIK